MGKIGPIGLEAVCLVPGQPGVERNAESAVGPWSTASPAEESREKPAERAAARDRSAQNMVDTGTNFMVSLESGTAARYSTPCALWLS